jgi:hypothetical protein
MELNCLISLFEISFNFLASWHSLLKRKTCLERKFLSKAMNSQQQLEWKAKSGAGEFYTITLWHKIHTLMISQGKIICSLCT